jgi:hypothetical protein
MLKATYVRQYRKKEGGNLVFVHTVSGDKKELAQYKKDKGEFYKEDDQKRPLFFSNRFAGQTCELRKTEKDYVLDTTVADQIKNLMDQGFAYELAVSMTAKATAQAAATEPAED